MPSVDCAMHKVVHGADGSGPWCAVRRREARLGTSGATGLVSEKSSGGVRATRVGIGQLVGVQRLLAQWQKREEKDFRN
jgi:hypothetical protein